MNNLLLICIRHGLAAFAFLCSVQAHGETTPSESASLQIRAIATSEREHYVGDLKRASADWCKTKANVCANELLIRPNGMTAPPPYDQIRLDLVSNLNGKFESSRYEHEKPFRQFAPQTFQFTSKLKVIVHPFVWNRVEVRSREQPTSLSPLTAWASRWMDISDTKQAPKGQLLGVIHSVTFPNVEGGYWNTVVDFGSSEPYMLDSLLRTLEAMGLAEVEIGSFHPVQR
jgi:hypothetical protein